VVRQVRIIGLHHLAPRAYVQAITGTSVEQWAMAAAVVVAVVVVWVLLRLLRKSISITC
jgi:hypothetical protein